jgi:hypothetical protein
MTDDELIALPTGSVFIYDVELYPNFILVGFRHFISGKVVLLAETPTESMNLEKLSFMLWHHCLVGFNSNNYDLLIVTMILNYRTLADIKQANDAIIYGGMRPFNFEKEFRVRLPQTNHIDLIDVAPLKASLKLYGGRLHCRLMQDLPYDPETPLTEEQMLNVAYYNVNDLETTAALLTELFPHIELRQNLGQQYGRDLRSLSDAQVAEAIVGTELHKVLGYYPKRPETMPGQAVMYTTPAGLMFKTPLLQYALDIVLKSRFIIDDNGSALMPEALAKLKLAIGTSVYKMGIGGLHSTEKEVEHLADEETYLIDRDVASYYPRIVLNQRLYPEHLGEAFLTVYETIVDRRLAAKKAGDKKVSEGLKIAINGIFGKFGNRYSIVYSPNLLLQVTLSGQLFLLMLIESIELAGIPVVSGNTDGIVIKCPKSRYDDLLAVIKEWEVLTGFETEETRYRRLNARDVNNYIAVKEDGTVKVKGAYSEKGSAQNSVLSKNPESLICSDAVQAYLSKGTPIAETVLACKDIRRFITVRQVKGGAEKDGEYLGRSIRWYFARGVVGSISYRTNGNKVPRTDGARPLMVLPDHMPDDVDYQYYINECQDILHDVGCLKRAASLTFF